MSDKTTLGIVAIVVSFFGFLFVLYLVNTRRNVVTQSDIQKAVQELESRGY